MQPERCRSTQCTLAENIHLEGNQDEEHHLPELMKAELQWRAFCEGQELLVG
jgi:hypothetical protein